MKINKTELNKMIDLIDDEFLAEAMEGQLPRRKEGSFRVFCLAACMALFISVTIGSILRNSLFREPETGGKNVNQSASLIDEETELDFMPVSGVLAKIQECMSEAEISYQVVIAECSMTFDLADYGIQDAKFILYDLQKELKLTVDIRREGASDTTKLSLSFKIDEYSGEDIQKEYGNKLKWYAFAGLFPTDEEIMRGYMDSGCQSLQLSIVETPNPLEYQNCTFFAKTDKGDTIWSGDEIEKISDQAAKYDYGIYLFDVQQYEGEERLGFMRLISQEEMEELENIFEETDNSAEGDMKEAEVISKKTDNSFGEAIVG